MKEDRILELRQMALARNTALTKEAIQEALAEALNEIVRAHAECKKNMAH